MVARLRGAKRLISSPSVRLVRPHTPLVTAPHTTPSAAAAVAGLTCVQPAVNEGLACGCRVLPVPRHHPRPRSQQQALLTIRQPRVGGGVHHNHLGTGGGQTH